MTCSRKKHFVLGCNPASLEKLSTCDKRSRCSLNEEEKNDKLSNNKKTSCPFYTTKKCAYYTFQGITLNPKSPSSATKVFFPLNCNLPISGLEIHGRKVLKPLKTFESVVDSRHRISILFGHIKSPVINTEAPHTIFFLY